MTPGSTSLDRAACLSLLAPGGHGRVAATMKAVPVIIPVTFTLSGEDLMFSPGPGPDVARAVADSVVAFETDAIGPDGRAVWDVHVTGVARTLTPRTEPQGFRLSSEVISGWHTGSAVDLGH